jgi:aspartyl-tRNA(Asn)/glutamyl-tRNA(Gln) amidotransferase subunit C
MKKRRKNKQLGVNIQMTITPEQVRHVANLARLSIEPAVVEKLAHQLATILAYMEKLNQVDTTGVQPTSHALELTNAFRRDEVHDSLTPDQALSNAPVREDGSFIVPKVI